MEPTFLSVCLANAALLVACFCICCFVLVVLSHTWSDCFLRKVEVEWAFLLFWLAWLSHVLVSLLVSHHCLIFVG